MTFSKRTFALDPVASDWLDRRAKRLKRSASAVLSDLILEAAREDARERVLANSRGMSIREKDVVRWVRKLTTREAT